MTIESLFRVRERGSSPRVEIIGGLTTFVSMAYIIVVNPAILSFAGLPPGPSTVATIVVAVIGSMLMGLYANRPIAVAPYMGGMRSSPSDWRPSESPGSKDWAQFLSAVWSFW